MILIIIAWLYLFFLSLSLGVWLWRIVTKSPNTEITPINIFYAFFLGFTLLIAILQFTSLFLPIAKTTFITISLIGICCAVYCRKFLFLIFRSHFRKVTPKTIVFLLLGCLTILLVSYSANREVDHADTFIYHFNAVRWVKEYPVIPGLANLHSRLGFNSSFFLFAAMTDIGIYSNESAHIAVSLLLVIGLVQWIVIIVDAQEIMSKRIFCMLTFTFLLVHSVWKGDINSLSTDYPTSILLLEFCLILLDKHVSHKLILLLPIAATIFTFKLSGMLALAFAMPVLAAYIVEWKFEKINTRLFGKIILSSVILSSLIFIGFLLRNAFVSGWLLYPFPFGNLRLPWSVPEEYVINIIEWIKSYPKIPGGASPDTINNNSFFYWFSPWFMFFRDTIEFKLLFISFLLTCFSLAKEKSNLDFLQSKLNLLLLLLFSITNLVFWFISAPDVRFGSIFFYIFLGSSSVLFYESTQLKNSFSIVVIFTFVLMFSNYSRFVIEREPMLFTFTYTKPTPLKKVLASPPGENPPLYIYMPIEGDACGNSPLPCSPYAGGKLHELRGVRQRVPGNIEKGFLPIPN